MWNWRIILNWLGFLCSIVEDDQLTRRPFQFTKIVCGIELILVLFRIVFNSEFFLFVSNLFCRYTRDSKRKCYLFLKLSMTRHWCHRQFIIFCSLVTPNTTLGDLSAIFGKKKLTFEIFPNYFFFTTFLKVVLGGSKHVLT